MLRKQWSYIMVQEQSWPTSLWKHGGQPGAFGRCHYNVASSIQSQHV